MSLTLTPKADVRQVAWAARAAYVRSLDAAARARLELTVSEQVLPRIRPGSAVASYWAIGDEIDPAQLEARLRAARCRIALPRVVAKDSPLVFLEAGAPETLLPNRLGILEPGPDQPVIMPSVLLVPLVAVDPRGYRIGQGAGYYDRTLQALRDVRGLRAIGLAWDCQLVDRVAQDPWDQPLDALATPTRWIDFKRPVRP
jgi:5-formyltetrahydrofolate cyclo-ligase